MKLYHTIALLLFMTFAVKILLIDGQWMITAIAGEEYVLVNPFCKSKNGSGTAGETSIHKFVDNQINVLDGVCSSILYLDVDGVEYQYNPISFNAKTFRTLPAYTVYLDTHYPPPQV